MSKHAGASGWKGWHGRLAAGAASISAAALVGAVVYAVPANADAPAVATLAVPTTSAEAPGPASFHTVTNATVRNAYDQQLFTPPTGSEGSYLVYRSNVDDSVDPTVTYYTPIPVLGTTVDLNDGLVLDLTTGEITAKATDLRMVDNMPPSFIVVANSGVGGATEASDGTPYGDTGGYTEIPVAEHDVSSGPFSIPVLYKDVPTSNDFSTPIYTLSGYGVMAGYADGSFQPTSPVSRQAFARFVTQLVTEGSYPPGPHPCTISGLGFLGLSGPFNDVSWVSPFCMDIMILSYLGIANGYDDGGFHPAAPISRQAMAAMTFRLFSAGVFPGSEIGDAECTTPIPFNDVDASNKFCGDIEWLYKNGLTNGFGDGGFHPTTNTSRQATAAFLYRFMNKYGDSLDFSGTGLPFPAGVGASSPVAKALADSVEAGKSAK